MNNSKQQWLPDDIWRNILQFIPRHFIQTLFVLNHLFHKLCGESILYADYTCRLKCIGNSNSNSGQIPVHINDETLTICLSIKFIHPRISILIQKWLKRMNRCRYLDMGNFPLDECYISDKGSTTAFVNYFHRKISAVHFDAFFSTKVKKWFLKNVISHISDDTKLVSLRWDVWNMQSLLTITVFQRIFNHFWLNFDARGSTFYLPHMIHTSHKLDALQMFTIYRVRFPIQTFQSLMDICPNLIMLYMFACNFDMDSMDEMKVIRLPNKLRSLSLLLCDCNTVSPFTLFNCCSSLKHITIDSPANINTRSILDQLMSNSNHCKFTELRQISITFWPGFSDISECEILDNTLFNPEKYFSDIIQLVMDTHKNSSARKFQSISINVLCSQPLSILSNILSTKLSNIYGSPFLFTVYDTNDKINVPKSCDILFGKKEIEHKQFVNHIKRIKFGMLRHT